MGLCNFPQITSLESDRTPGPLNMELSSPLAGASESVCLVWWRTQLLMFSMELSSQVNTKLSRIISSSI